MTDEIITSLAIAGAAAGSLVVCVFVWFVVVLRQLDRGWRRMQGRRQELEGALKERASLMPQLVAVTRHRLTGERDTLEGLSHLRSKSIGGRTPGEKARAEAELDRALSRSCAPLPTTRGCPASANSRICVGRSRRHPRR